MIPIYLAVSDSLVGGIVVPTVMSNYSSYKCLQFSETGRCLLGSSCPKLHVSTPRQVSAHTKCGDHSIERSTQSLQGQCIQFADSGTCIYGSSCKKRHYRVCPPKTNNFLCERLIQLWSRARPAYNGQNLGLASMEDLALRSAHMSELYLARSRVGIQVEMDSRRYGFASSSD